MIALEHVTRSYQTPRGRIDALADVSLAIDKGRFVVVCGPSGSGKTTLLMTIAAMLRPTAGTVRIHDADLYAMSIRRRARYRAANIGFVFQMFHLIPYLNVAENVRLGGSLLPAARKKHRADELIEQLGLSSRRTHLPAELSAGEKQRAAVARALLSDPDIILADEPTGNLDPANETAVLTRLSKFHRKGGTVIIATHGPAASPFADQTLQMANGRLLE